MAITRLNQGSSTHNTAATSFTLTLLADMTAGATLVLGVTADNSSTGGATNDFTTVTDSRGNTWTKRQSPIFDNGAASAGIQGAIYDTKQNAGTLLTGDTITVSFGSSPTAKGWTLEQLTCAANNTVEYVTGGVNTGATTGTPTVTTGTITVGDIVIAYYHSENTGAVTGDADTTNGTWTTVIQNTIGTTTSGIRHAVQTKIQTTADSTQTFNPTAASQDCILSWAQYRETPVPTDAPFYIGAGYYGG